MAHLSLNKNRIEESIFSLAFNASYSRFQAFSKSVSCLHTYISFDCVFVELPYNDYFEYYGPDFKLHISPSNMANQNTPEYLDKIKARLFENMRMLPHAPGVQMTGTYTRSGNHEFLQTLSKISWHFLARVSP